MAYQTAVRNDTLFTWTEQAEITHFDLDTSAFAGQPWSLQLVYTDGTPAAKTFVSGVAEVDQITFAAKSSTTNGDYFVINDYLGGSWAIALDTLGTGAATPTGAAWLAVPAANKAYLDISSATTGTDISTLVHTALNALTGFTAVITAATSTTHQNCTAAWSGVVTTPAVYSKAGASGTGSVTFAITTPGTLSKVAATGNTVSITAHGYTNGDRGQLTTTSGLPTGLSTSTDYYIIVVDANTIKFASSLANSLAGTAVAITGFGVGTHTFTATTLATTGAVAKLQASNDGTNFTDLASQTVTITAAGNILFYIDSTKKFRVCRVLFTPTTGAPTVVGTLFV